MTIKLEDAEGEWRALHNVVYLNADEIIEGMRQGKIRMYQRVEEPFLGFRFVFGDRILARDNPATAWVVVRGECADSPLHSVALRCANDHGELGKIYKRDITFVFRDGKQIYPKDSDDN